MSSTITVRGFAATQPKFVVVNGLSIASFRIGSSERRYNRATGNWESGPTSWFSVRCFRELATNVFASVSKGDPIIVSGRLKVSEWSAGEKSGLDVEIEAEGIGHDFRWGKSAGFIKNNGKASAGPEAGAQASDEAQPPSEQAADAGVASWNPPGLTLGSSRVLDAGEPSTLGLLELDEDTGEVLEATSAAAPPF